MRLVDLARIADEAEALRLKLLTKRQAMRGGYGAVAALFAIFVAIMLHLVIFVFLAEWLGAQYAALVLLGLDAVGIAVFGLMAARSKPGPVELEAEAISRQARAELTHSVKTFVVVAPVAKLAGAKGVRGLLMTALASRFLAGRRRAP